MTDLVARPDTTVFSQALGITGIGNSLASGDEYTLLVPTDQALLRYLDDAGLILEELTTVDTDELYDLIASHIVVGEALPLEEFVIGDSYVTLNNNKVLTLRSSIEPIAVEADLVGCNAQVHIVSYVVRPQTLTDGSETPATAPSPPVVEAPAPVVEAPVTVPSPPVVEAPAPEADLPASTAASVEPAPESDLIPRARGRIPKSHWGPAAERGGSHPVAATRRHPGSCPVPAPDATACPTLVRAVDRRCVVLWGLGRRYQRLGLCRKLRRPRQHAGQHLHKRSVHHIRSDGCGLGAFWH